MKTSIILIMLVLLVSLAKAQENEEDPVFSLRGGIGYNFPLAGGYIATNNNSGISGAGSKRNRH